MEASGLLKEAKINNLPLKDTQDRVQAFFMQFNQLRATARPVVQCVMKSSHNQHYFWST